MEAMGSGVSSMPVLQHVVAESRYASGHVTSQHHSMEESCAQHNRNLVLRRRTKVVTQIHVLVGRCSAPIHIFNPFSPKHNK